MNIPSKNKLFFVDVETTGKNPHRCGIIKLAGKVVTEGQEIYRFNYKMRPFATDVIEKEALQVNGCSLEEIKSWPDPQVVLRDFVFNIDAVRQGGSWLDNLLIPVGYNVGFDISFLKELFIKCRNQSFNRMFSFCSFDVYSLVRLFHYIKLIPTTKDQKLQTVCASMGISLKNAHDAMADIEATEALFNMMITNIGWKKEISNV